MLAASFLALDQWKPWRWLIRGEWTEEQLIYSASALLLGLVLALLVRVSVLKRLNKRLERLDEIENFEAVQTVSPVADPLSRALAHAEKSVRSRYSVINRMATVLLLLIALVAAVFPLLGSLPQAVVSVFAAIGAAVLGIAAKPFVENLISGVVISFSNQLRIGDTVMIDDQYYGTVEDITITHTVVKLWDWRRHIVPNAVMLQKDFTNYTHRDNYLWAHVEFRVEYDADLDLVERLAVEAGKRSKYCAGYEDPQMWVRSMEERSILIWLGAWAKSPEDAWELRADIRRTLVGSLRDHGIRTQLERLELRPRPLTAAPASSRRGTESSRPAASEQPATDTRPPRRSMRPSRGEDE